MHAKVKKKSKLERLLGLKPSSLGPIWKVNEHKYLEKEKKYFILMDSNLQRPQKRQPLFYYM